MSDEQNNSEPLEKQTSRKRLYRSRRHRMIGGICGGLAEYFGIDQTLVRIAMVVLAFAGGWGIIAYIIGLVIIPEHPAEGEEEPEKHKPGDRSPGFVWGLLFIIAGLIFLSVNYGWFPWPMWRFWHFSWKFIWPLVIILIGVVLLLSRPSKKGQGAPGEGEPSAESERKLTRSRRERMIGGVCGGIADYFRLDPTLVRLLWAFGTIVSQGLGIIAYIILLIVLPEEALRTE